LPGRRRVPARERRDVIAAGVASRTRRSEEESVPAGMIVGLPGRAHRRQATESRVPADEVGAKALELARGCDELHGKAPRVEQVEVLPHRIGADDDRRANLANEVCAIDGDGAADTAVVDNDLDRLPAESDLTAARADCPRPGLHEPLHAAGL